MLLRLRVDGLEMKQKVRIEQLRLYCQSRISLGLKRVLDEESTVECARFSF